MDTRQNIKLVVVGERLSGKTSLINRYLRNEFDESIKNECFGVDFEILKYPYGPLEYSVQIWDTVGLEKYRSITKSYFHFSSCVIIAVDVSNPFSLSKLDPWLQDIESNVLDKNLCQIVLALTKTDLEKQIDMSFLEIFCERYDIKYFEVSSKTGENVFDFFDSIIKDAIIRKNKLLLSQNRENFKDYHSSTDRSTQQNSRNSVCLSSSHQAKKSELPHERNCCFL